MIAEKVYILSKVKYLSELNAQELTELANDFYWEEYAEGVSIVQQGQEQHHFYVLVEGKLEMLETNHGSGEFQVSTIKPGGAFGARALLAGGTAPFTVRCLVPCKLLVINEQQFTHMLGRWPKIYKIFIERLSQSLDKVSKGLWEARQKDFLLTSIQQSRYENKFYGLWGSPKTTKMLENKVSELSQSKNHLLLIGERGTGRQMMGWYLHRRKYGEAAPFLVVSGRDLEKQWGQQIFAEEGQEEAPIKSSILDYVSGGTLFINEINQLSPRTQLKMAEALRTNRNNCLVIGSLQQEPETMEQLLVPELRELFADLFKLTPLRERKRDIPFLAQGILEKLAGQHKRPTPSLDHEATQLLLSHNYHQGNVTELIQVIERAFFLAEHEVISLEHVFFGPTSKKIGGTFDLLSFSWLENLIKKGVFVQWMRRITAIIFISIIISLFVVPSATINIGLFALVWGLWWPALAILSPLLGRLWCTVCPFSYVMELVQKKIHWKRPVPDFIKKYNYLLITFLFLLIFWVEAIFPMRSNPTYTGILLVVIMGAAILIGIIFIRHTWCQHLCPLGGFVGMASIGALLEVRADSTVCLNKCTTYDCYKGNSAIAGCPMSQYAPFVDNNMDCKLCFNCVRNCKNGAVKLNLRIPAREVWHLVRVNQGFVIFIGVVLAILAPISYFEPLRHTWPLGVWILWFSLYYWGIAILAGLLTWVVARPFKTKAASKKIKLVFAFIPLVIAGHIIYQLHFLPGADAILLGLGYITATGDVLTFNVPALEVGQFLAIMIGLSLTVFTILMVMLRSRGKFTGGSMAVGKTPSTNNDKKNIAPSGH